MNIRALEASGGASGQFRALPAAKGTKVSWDRPSMAVTGPVEGSAAASRMITPDSRGIGLLGSKKFAAGSGASAVGAASLAAKSSPAPRRSSVYETMRQVQTEGRAAADALKLEEDAKVASGDFERLPEWQRPLRELFTVLGGDQWKESSGWPAAGVLPAGSAAAAAKAGVTVELYGVTRPGARPDEVVSLDLAWNNLAGDLGRVEALWQAKGLEVLHLGANKLTGVVPGRHFSAKGPSRIKELHLYRNGLRGQLPYELGELRCLESLWLFENHFSGQLPDCFGALTSLVDLRVNSNRLTGKVPPSLGGCAKLEVLNLQKNALSGPIPEEVLTSCHKLKDLRLWSNKLTGPLSPEVSCLRHLEVLLVQRNQLNWVVPASLGKCRELRKLDLSNNQFRGELPPAAFGNLVHLEALSLANNPRLCGEIPREIRQLRCLLLIDLSGTSLEDLDEFASDVAAGKSAAPPSVKVIVEGYSRDPLS